MRFSEKLASKQRQQINSLGRISEKSMPTEPSGLQWATVRNLLMAWVLTLPAAITRSGSLFVLFVNVF